MSNGKNTQLSFCNYHVFLQKNGRIKSYNLALLLSSFLIHPALAENSAPEINTEYLNALTGPKVTWESATESGSDTVLINGAYYKYTYNMPETEENEIFIGKTKENLKHVGGAAISGSHDDVVSGVFVGNGVYGNASEWYDYPQAAGGAISVFGGRIDNINGNFIGNYATSDLFAAGGAVYGDIGYTFGDAYDAYDANLGVNYSW